VPGADLLGSQPLDDTNMAIVFAISATICSRYPTTATVGRMRRIIITLTAAAILMSGCSDSTDEGVADEEVADEEVADEEVADEEVADEEVAGLCETQDSVDEDLAALDALDPVTDSAEDYFAALGNLKESANDLLSASLDLIGQDIENINNADSDLQDSLAEAAYTLDGVREVTLAEAGSALVTGVETQIAELEAFYAEAYAGSSCS
jgi:hypothetical protein